MSLHTTLFHILFLPAYVCLSYLHILSHAHCLSFATFSFSITCLCVFLFYFLPFFRSYYPSLFLFSHIPVTSSVPHHHLDSHSSALYHLWKRTFSSIQGPWCCSSPLIRYLLSSLYHSFIFNLEAEIKYADQKKQKSYLNVYFFPGFVIKMLFQTRLWHAWQIYTPCWWAPHLFWTRGCCAWFFFS